MASSKLNPRLAAYLASRIANEGNKPTQPAETPRAIPVVARPVAQPIDPNPSMAPKPNTVVAVALDYVIHGLAIGVIPQPRQATRIEPHGPEPFRETLILYGFPCDLGWGRNPNDPPPPPRVV